MTDTPSPQAVSLLSDIDAEMEGRRRGYADVRGELLFRCRDFIALSASPALAAETGGEAVAPRGEVTDEWADRFCEAVNWSPDGQECKVVEGEMRCVTFRQIAKGHILAAIATGPEAHPAAGGGLDREAVARIIDPAHFGHGTLDSPYRQALALAKADAILALTATEATDYARSVIAQATGNPAPHAVGIANGDEPKTLRAKDSSQ